MTDLATARPIRTIYINNLNTKINRLETEKLLYSYFSQFGSILDIVISRHPKHRGQAYLAYRDLESSAAAIRGAHSFPLGGKPMKVCYARRETDKVAEFLGVGNEMIRKKLAAKRAKGLTTVGDGITLQKKPKPDKIDIKSKTTEETLIGDPEAPKNPTLFVENLPENRTQDQVEVLFNQFDGFKELRLNDSKKNIAFVEFSDAFTAERAKKALDRFNMTPTNVIKVTYARI